MMSLMLLMMLVLPLHSEESKEITILFTHDLHSHLLPAEDTDGGEYGVEPIVVALSHSGTSSGEGEDLEQYDKNIWFIKAMLK